MTLCVYSRVCIWPKINKNKSGVVWLAGYLGHFWLSGFLLGKQSEEIYILHIFELLSSLASCAFGKVLWARNEGCFRLVPFSLVFFKQPTTSLMHSIVFSTDPPTFVFQGVSNDYKSFLEEDEVWSSGKYLELEVRQNSSLSTNSTGTH